VLRFSLSLALSHFEWRGIVALLAASFLSLFVSASYA